MKGFSNELLARNILVGRPRRPVEVEPEIVEGIAEAVAEQRDEPELEPLARTFKLSR